MIENIREKANTFLTTRKTILTGYIVVIVLLTTFINTLFEDNLLLSFIVEVLNFAAIGALILTILDTYRGDDFIASSNYFENLKVYGANLLMLGLLVEGVKFVVIEFITSFLSSILVKLPLDFLLISSSFILLVSTIVSLILTYMFVFSAYYLKDRNLTPLQAFMASYQNTRGKKMDLFNIELKYHIVIVTAVAITMLIGFLFRSPEIFVLSVLVGLIVAIFYLPNILTVRTIYYLENDQSNQVV